MHIYHPGDTYPFDGEADEKRAKELSSKKNRLKKPLIVNIKDEKSEGKQKSSEGGQGKENQDSNQTEDYNNSGENEDNDGESDEDKD